MRLGTPAFQAAAQAAHKEPRFTIELAFDSANETLRYFTSHADSAVPPGAAVLARTVEGLSVVSQKLDADKAVATIGTISFGVADRALMVTQTLAAQLLIGRSTRHQRVRVFEGYKGLAFADYLLIATQIVDDISVKDGRYSIQCADIQRAMREDIFAAAETTLAASIGPDDLAIPVVDTAALEAVAHGASYSDAPNLTRGYVRIDDEVIRWSAKTPTELTADQRGALNTRAVAHAIDPNASADRQTKVTEYVYLELPAAKLAYAVLTGELLEQPGARLPENWQLGIAAPVVEHADDARGPVVDTGTARAVSALSFDGVDDEVRIPDAATLDFGSGDFTVETNMRRSAASPEDANLRVLDKSSGIPSSSGPGYVIWNRDTTVVFELGNGSSKVGVSFNAALESDFVHVAGVRDGNTLRLVVDGVERATADITGFGSISNADDLVFGGRSTGPGATSWAGDLADTREWNVARSVAEIAEHRSHTLQGNEPGLVGYWPLFEGAGVTAKDFTANGNDGTLNNGPTWISDHPFLILAQLIRLAATAPAVDDVLNGLTVRLADGRERVIADYDGATQVAVTAEQWPVNLVRGTDLAEAVVGDPGTLPSHWFDSGNNTGIVGEVVGVGTEDGIPYIDFRWQVTPPGPSSEFGLIFEVHNGHIPAAVGDVFSDAVFVKVVGGSVTNINIIELEIMIRNAPNGIPERIGNLQLLDVINDAATPLSDCRHVQEGIDVTAADAFAAQPYLKLFGTIGEPHDITLRVGIPQLARGATIGDPITTGDSPLLLPDATTGYEVRLAADMVRLAATASAVDDAYNGLVLVAGATGEQRLVRDYRGLLQIAVLERALALAAGAPYEVLSSLGYVRKHDFLNIGRDLYDPADDREGFLVRFSGEEESDGKEFVEEQLMLLLGCFMPIYSDGTLGLKRMSNTLAGAAYVAELNESNVVAHEALRYDFKALHNQITIDWNYEPLLERTTRKVTLIDAPSVATHQLAKPYEREFRGLHGSRHSSVILQTRFDSIRDRYTGPPLRSGCTVLPSLAGLEVGDVVRDRVATVRDPVAGGPLDRSFEVQQVQVDKITGRVGLKLFASSQAPGALAPTADATVIADAWYASEGTELSTVLTITGADPGHVSADGTLTGEPDMGAAGAIYYYLGDLVIDAGVTVTLDQNVQLRVRGHLTVNGAIAGVGGGLAGAAQVAPLPAGGIHPVSVLTAHNPGTPGFIGTPKSAGGYAFKFVGFPFDVWAPLAYFDGYVTEGANPVVPAMNLVVVAGELHRGIPRDMRGSSGATGNPVFFLSVDTFPPPTSGVAVRAPGGLRGGAGGAGGAGLCVVCRGMSFGASGRVDLSGGDGQPGELATVATATHRAGSGAGGAPGGLLVVLDGSLAAVPSLGVGFAANYGETPIVGRPLANRSRRIDQTGDNYPYYVGHGDGSTFALPTLSGLRGGARAQFVPADEAAEADPAPTVLAPPTMLSVVSDQEWLQHGDGTVVPRIKVTWTASTDPRVLAYEIQFREAPTGPWQSAPLAIGELEVWLTPVRDGQEYDVRIRAAGAARQVSIWVEVLGVIATGKDIAPPAPDQLVVTLQQGGLWKFAWSTTNVPSDLRGAEIRWFLGATGDFNVMTPLHEGFLQTSPYENGELAAGEYTFAVRNVDRSGNESAATFAPLFDGRPLNLHELSIQNWTLRESGVEDLLVSVARGGANNDIYVACGGFDQLSGGTDSMLLRSINGGASWSRLSHGKDITLKGVDYNGRWVVVGSRFIGGGGGDPDAYILTSDDDGETWVERSNPQPGDLESVIWVEDLSLWVAVGFFNDATTGDPGTYILTSPDGATWTQRTAPRVTRLKDAVWNGSLLVAVGLTGLGGSSPAIFTSPDGINWTEQTDAPALPNSYELDSIVWSGALLVAVGGVTDDQLILTSPTGVTWTRRTSPHAVPRGDLRALWTGRVFLSVGEFIEQFTAEEGVQASYSLDGLTWRAINIELTRVMRGLVWTGHHVLAVGGSGFVYTSLDV